MSEEPTWGDIARKLGLIAKRSGMTAVSEAKKLPKKTKEQWKKVDAEYSLMEKAGELGKAAGKVAEEAETLYGEGRQRIKPFSPADTPSELFEKTKDELTYIVACILQIGRSEAGKWTDRFGKSLMSKMAAAGTTTSLLGLVATFGAAGTGTAISTLSGAAAASATLAWVGGLIGGGVAAGTFLTGGVGLVVGATTYKLLSSKARPFEDLSEVDKGVVETCSVLVSAIDQTLESADELELTREEAAQLLNNTFLPLEASLRDNQVDICSRLDGKNAAAFRQHALPDFRRVVIDGFAGYADEQGPDRPVSSSGVPEAVIGGVFYALLCGDPVGQDMESQMVLEALRRSDPDLAGANEAGITEYLAGYSPDQLKGIANNVKGIYHELRFVKEYDATHTTTQAVLFDAPNYPGADVKIQDVATGEVVEEIQLKATDSTAYLNEHVLMYPEIRAVATDEVSAKFDGVSSTGINNAEITEQVSDDLDDLANNTPVDQTFESAALIGVIAAGKEAIDVLQGRKSVGEASRKTVELMSAGAAATGIAAFLFS